MIPSGKDLRRLQKAHKVSVTELSKRTKLTRASIFRAFKDEATKDSTRVLLYLAITEPDLFVQFRTKNNASTNDDLLRALYLAQKEMALSSYVVTRTYNCILQEQLDMDKVLSGGYSDEDYMQIRRFGAKSLELLHRAIDIHKGDLK